MSMIASFHIIADGKREGLARAAEVSALPPRKRFGIFPIKDSAIPDFLWDFLGKHAEEMEPYPYSGSLLLDIELMAPGALSRDDELADRLCRAMQSTFVTYRPAEGARVGELLGAADFSDEAIKQYLAEEGREAEYPEIVGPLRDSVRRMKEWLEAMPAGTTGVLSIG